MGAYVIRRLLLAIPTLLIISMLAFGLSRNTPGDPIENFLPRSAPGGGTYDRYAESYERIARDLHFDLPPFYFSIRPLAYPDTLHRILVKDRRTMLRLLLDHYGNWELIQVYYRKLQATERQLSDIQKFHRSDAVISAQNHVSNLYIADELASVTQHLAALNRAVDSDSVLRQQLDVYRLEAAYRSVEEQPLTSRRYLPALHWYGLDNQYHYWLSDLLRGDFGTTYRDQRPVSEVVWDAVRWTLLLNGLAILLAYLLSVPIGVYAAVYEGSRFDRWGSFLLFGLYSLPNFWAAMLLTTFLTTPDYGLDLFPIMGMGDIAPDAAWWEILSTRLWHLVLPVFCLTYPPMAFISRQMRAAMLAELQKDYVRTARARGLSPRRVIWGHAFRNAVFPLITMLASVLPAALAGSVLIEVIFNIPGIGQLTVNAISTQDWPVVYALLLLASILTIAGILLSDLLYSIADPRVRFKRIRG